ncbi:MAG: dTDP-4-dehydrorhamnose reductase [Verrucomicrobia bacterium]|nr:dTDP-4-dehydrorhamnose reductase [Verrucomicrobiota bacterium]MBU4291020.1 dTDP-4-dehydrorhamnose reductase [Verrucomicrobiota bacterium]MBU4429897.1 dTDP-4-dehydrorhamnose reductase [Verrucomicrobiota bacterium]MCG2678910.1 dTDP-4-dehydrorhamnose reductase [Kiritimatiellia bacterium]
MAESVSILGGRGMLGSDLADILKQSNYAVQVWDLPDWDITCPGHIERAVKGAAVVVNCAAYTNVDKAEEQADIALAVNATAVGQLGRLAQRHHFFLVHISTDFVFDGQGDQPYQETDTPSPISVYGQSKWQGELALRESACASAILRVEWSYGRHGVNFVTKFLGRARAGSELKVVNDQFGAPTWTADMAKAIECLIRGRHQGLYHFANAGYASRYDVACFIAGRLKLASKIVPCSSGEFPVKARRPANSRFNTAKIQAVLDHPIRSWQDALTEFLALR